MTEAEYAGGAMAERVADLVLPILADLGMELYDCEHVGGIVRVTVSRPAEAEDQRLDLDAIALVTRLLSRELDHADPIPGKYTLEVTSPGLERVLRRPAHYQSAIGALVSIRLTGPIDGARRFQGTLVSVDDTGITLRLDDAALTEQRLPFDRIERARTVFLWGPTPKPGGKQAGGKPSGRKPAASSAGSRAEVMVAAHESESETESDPTTQEAGAS
jgi:ribosome maturation factor RimP